MSKSAYWEDRHRPESKKNMFGVMTPRKHCIKCKGWKQTTGGKIVTGMHRVQKFTCADCLPVKP